MGKILRTSKLTTGAEAAIVLLGIIMLGAGLYFFAPFLNVEESKVVEALDLNNDILDNELTSEMLPLPSEKVSLDVVNQPLVRIGGYAWNAQQGIYGATGGNRTTKGSIMESLGVNLELVRQDWLSELKAGQMKFIEQYNSGQAYPESEKAFAGIMIMGDGVPFYISTMQSAINEKFGNDKYHVKAITALGASYGEDKFIGLPEWKANPQSMRGSLVSVVVGDGDWVTLLNYCYANKVPVNPDFTTYDPNAVNIFPSKDDDYVNSAKELIASQTEGFTVNLKVVEDGKLTGETIDKSIDGCATWTPADEMVFDALSGYTVVASTRDFPNQMATTLVVVTEWAHENPELVSNIIKGSLTCSNQMKQYDQWRRSSADCIAQGFGMEDGDYWYAMFKGQDGVKNGVPYSVGGSRLMNYADVMQYYGITDGVNRYKSVYNQVSNYLVEMNPFGFNESVERVIPYNEAVDLYFLKNINDIDAGVVATNDYAEVKTDVMASGEYHINFATGSSTIESSSYGELETVYNLLVQAEQTRVTVVGHTDNTGSASLNLTLSEQRAQSVANYLTSRGISVSRIQSVEGLGSAVPIADNSTYAGRAQNRRVQISLLQ